jgi:hypothetical protein
MRVIVAVGLATMLWFMYGCSYGGVELDPRDEEAVADWENAQCDNRSARVTLQVRVDPGVTGVEAWLFKRSGGQRRLGMFVSDRDVRLTRADLEVGGWIELKIGQATAERLFLDLLACDVATLIIAYPINFSFYMGQDLDRD